MLNRHLPIVLGTISALSLGSSTRGQCTGHAVLTDYERSEFLSVAYSQPADVTLQFLSTEGCSRAMLDSLRQMGASVRFSDEKIGYVLVKLRSDKILDTLALSGIAYASAPARFRADEDSPIVPLPERKAAPVPSIEIPFPRVEKIPAKDGPYFAAAEAGLTTFWQQHPEADGRGTRVALVDQGVDLLHPALQVAKDVDGNAVPKVADIITLTDPGEDPNWVQFGDVIQTKDGRFEAAGRNWRVQQDGAYRFGIFSRQLSLWPDVPTEKESSHKRLSLSVGVLWDEQERRVWVDTDGDGDFRNEPALGDYAKTHDVGYFGREDGENDNRIPFGIKIDPPRRAAYLSIADGYHGGMVEGPLAANRLTGGLFDGAAPSAQIVDTRMGSYMPSLLSSFARPDVDVINRSGVIGLWTENGLDDFNLHVVERAVKVYDKPIVSISVLPNTLTVSDYQSPEMLRRNRQLQPPYAEAMTGGVLFLSGHGVINSVMAPSASLITQSRYMPFAVAGKDGRSRSANSDMMLQPPAPAGYGIGNNPSPTIPVVSGILADLIGEARREHVRYNGVRLMQAVLTGSRLIPGFSAAEQGFGLVNAAEAWHQLVKMAGADDPSNSMLTSFSVARQRDGQREEVHGFLQEFSEPGAAFQGEIWITRRGGYSGGRAYTFSLRGDDGTFKLLDQHASFVRDQPVRVRFSAGVTRGLHAAFLQLRDAQADVVMQEIPFAVRAPDRPQEVAPGVEKYEAQIPPMHVDRRLVRLGEEVQAARFHMRIPYEGPGVLFGIRMMPGFWYGTTGNRFAGMAKPPGPPMDAAHHVGPEDEFESLVLNAKPGTQDVLWDNFGKPEYATPYDDPAPDVPIRGTLTVTKYAVGFSRKDAHSVLVSNKLAAGEGRVEFYDAKLAESDLTTKAPHGLDFVERALPAHLSQWRVSISADSLRGPVADAYLLECVGDNGCDVAKQSRIGSNATTLVVDNPKEGKWRIAVWVHDGAKQPLSATFHVTEATLVPNPSEASPEYASHESGASWSATLPSTDSDALYVAFRIRGTAGRENQNDGLRIGMTPLTSGAP